MAIVQAVGVATSHGGSLADVARNKRLEAVMLEAVREAQAEGISDPEEIRRRTLKARDEVLDAF